MNPSSSSSSSCSSILRVLLLLASLSRSSSERRLGCLFESELCSPYEICVNDGMFGKCHSVPVREVYTYDVSTSVVQRFRMLLEKLSNRGLTWQDDTTQQVLSKELSKLRRIPYRPQQSAPVYKSNIRPVAEAMDPVDQRVKPVEVELSRNLQSYLQRLGLLPKTLSSASLSGPGKSDRFQSGIPADVHRPKAQTSAQNSSPSSFYSLSSRQPLEKQRPLVDQRLATQSEGELLLGALRRYLSGRLSLHGGGGGPEEPGAPSSRPRPSFTGGVENPGLRKETSNPRLLKTGRTQGASVKELLSPVDGTGLCDNIIQDIIYGFLVLPNSIKIPLVGEAALAALRFPIPKGILRIHFIEAQDLLIKDKLLGGLIKGKSDPYGVVQVGTQVFQSKIKHETINPKWNEVYEAMVYDHSGPNVGIELFDDDPDKDDFLGSLVLNLAELQKEQKVDEWFVLEEVASGKLHLKLEWLSPLPAPDQLDQALLNIGADRSKANDGLSSALLVVFLDSARNLPSVFEGNLGSGYLKERRAAGLVFCENTASLYRTLFRNPLEFNPAGLKKATFSKALKSGKKVTSDPNPLVHFRVGNKDFDSKIRYKTKEPFWEESFTFLIHNPRTQQLEVEVKDTKHECSLGTVTLPLTRLLEADDMTLDQRFPLKNSGPSCTIKMKVALRVLCQVKDTSPAPNSAPNSAPSSVPVPKSSGQTTRPSASSDSKLPSPSPPVNPPSASLSAQDLMNRQKDPGEYLRSPGSTDLGQGGAERGGRSLAESGRSSSNLAISSSQQYLAGGKEPTPSIASDISNPYATQELQQRLHQLQNGSGPSYFPLGEVQLTVRHSSQRNKLIVVVHGCRNLIAFTDQGSDPYVRLYLLPDKRRSGRRKTHTFKKTLNPVYDQTFEFSVSLVELHRRTLDVAVKNSGGLLSKHKGLLGKVLVDLTHEDITKSWTQWYELSEDGLARPPQL